MTPTCRNAIVNVLLLTALPTVLLSQVPQVLPVTIANTELHPLHSKIVGVDYNIYVSLPANYATSHDTFPVVYTTDANRTFGIVAGVIDMLTNPAPQIPRVVLISIGYPDPGIGPTLAWGIGRTRDLTPTNVAAANQEWATLFSRLAGRDIAAQTGGAPAFLRFIREELIPWAEAHYRISHTDRTLGGYSFGGLFTLYVLFHSPETFQRYYAGSPSMSYDNGVLFTYEESAATGRRDLPARLFMTVGSLETAATIQNVDRLAAQLRARHYPSLQVETHVFEGETHASCAAAAASRALRVLFAQREHM